MDICRTLQSLWYLPLPFFCPIFPKEWWCIRMISCRGRLDSQLLLSPFQNNWQVIIFIQQKSVKFRSIVGCVGELFESNQCSFTILETCAGTVVWTWATGHLLIIGWLETASDYIFVHLPHRLVIGASPCCQICNNRSNAFNSRWAVTTFIPAPYFDTVSINTVTAIHSFQFHIDCIQQQ